MTILKALKDRIRSMGGETNATNIADAIKDLPKGGSSELPPEVENAVETHGMGWTSEEPIPAINITWDGDTEGRESFGVEEVFYKVNDKELTVEELVGSTVSIMFEGTIEQHIILNSDIITEDLPEDLAVVYIEFDSGVSGVIYTGDISELGFSVSNGTYFSKTSEAGITAYITSLTKEASTQEVVHRIDSKYIPDVIPTEVSSAVRTHGIGWTMETEGFNFTWDGTGYDPELRSYKVSDKCIYDDSELQGAIVSNTMYEDDLIIGETAEVDSGEVPGVGRITTIRKVRSQEEEETWDLISILDLDDPDSSYYGMTSGTYFNVWRYNTNCYTSAFAKESEEVVHQIDEKYIPSSGGAMVVTFTMGSGGIEADMTVEEVQTAMMHSVVVGVIDAGSEQIPLGIACLIVNDAMSDVGFGAYISNNNLTYRIYSDNGIWNFHGA